jgi:ribulose-5-phosphate 4-epimerase/fuculose-1-phosphate aldolase
MADVSKTVVDDLKKRLIEGLYILTEEGIMTFVGHLSVRVPGTDTFLINPRFAANVAEMDDICTVNMDGKRVDGPGPIPGETPIHTEILRKRPEVNSVVHCHPKNSVLLPLTGSEVVPFNIVAHTFHAGVPVYPESHQIDTKERGEKVAEALGDHLAVFQMGHGIAAVGPSIEGTCLVTVRLEMTCRDQLELMKYTTPEPLHDPDMGNPWKGLSNNYREWPYLQQLHKSRPQSEIKANIPMPVEGSRSRDNNG